MKLSHTIDANTKFEQGHFILNNNRQDIKYDFTEDIYVTLDNNYALKNKLIEIFKTAEKYIKVCSFILSDKEIVGVLEDVLKKKTVPVFILTSIIEYKFTTDILSDEENDDFGEKHFKCIEKLSKLGAHIRAHEGAHAKFAITESHAFLMTANVTENSFNQNPESAIIIDDNRSP